ncbi:hypothetical protein D3C87_1233520 [compost metagenome]
MPYLCPELFADSLFQLLRNERKRFHLGLNCDKKRDFFGGAAWSLHPASSNHARLNSLDPLSNPLNIMRV